MRYAAQREDGSWTGALYAEVTDRIRTHHGGYGETLHPVVDLTERDGHWSAVLPDIDQLRAVMSCSRYQGREALRRAGLFDAAVQQVSESGDATMQGAWEETTTWNRTSPFIEQMGGALGLTPEQIDDLFNTATTITA